MTTLEKLHEIDRIEERNRERVRQWKEEKHDRTGVQPGGRNQAVGAVADERKPGKVQVVS